MLETDEYEKGERERIFWVLLFFCPWLFQTYTFPPSALTHTTALVLQGSAFVRTEHVTIPYLMLRLNYDQCFAATLLAALIMM